MRFEGQEILWKVNLSEVHGLLLNLSQNLNWSSSYWQTEGALMSFLTQLSNIEISKWPLGLVTSDPLAAETSGRPVAVDQRFRSLLQAKLLELSSISAGLRSPIHPFDHLSIHAPVHHHPSAHPSIFCPVCLRKQWLPWWCLTSPAASRTQTSARSIDVFRFLPATVVHLGSLFSGRGFFLVESHSGSILPSCTSFNYWLGISNYLFRSLTWGFTYFFSSQLCEVVVKDMTNLNIYTYIFFINTLRW